MAFTQLFNQTLVAEIIGTNNIEGVKTTKQEVQTAIASVGKSEEKVRLQSFVRMYFKIKQNLLSCVNCARSRLGSAIF